MVASQVLFRLHFCEHVLLALVATHQDPKKLRAVLDEAFASALSPDAPEYFARQRNEFLARLHGAFGEDHAACK